MAKILLLTSEFLPFKGGIGTYVRELAAAAQAAGHSVVVAAPDYGGDQRALDAGFPFRVIRYRGGEATMRGLPGRILLTRRLVAQEQFDIVHAADWPFFIALRLLSRRRAPRRLMTFHGTEILYMQAPKRRRLLDLIGFWKHGWAEWISNSRYTHELALATFPIDPAEARAVPLGVSDSWAAGRIDRDTARGALGLSSEIVIVSLGRVVPRKGHAVLADALAQLRPEQSAHVRWWVIGPLQDEDFVARLRATAAGLAVPTDFFGALPDLEVRQRLSAADIFCLPGYQDEAGRVEGFGLVFLEAAAYGVPAIATVSGGIGEAVDDGSTGMLVPEKDSAALALALGLMIDDGALRHRMAEAAIHKAARSTWRHVMEATYDAGKHVD